MKQIILFKCFINSFYRMHMQLVYNEVVYLFSYVVMLDIIGFHFKSLKQKDKKIEKYKE